MVNIPVDRTRGRALMVPRVFGPFRGRAQGRAQGRRFVIRSEGGGSQKPDGEDHNPPFHFAPAGFGFLELDRTTRAASAGRGKTGATPPL